MNDIVRLGIDGPMAAGLGSVENARVLAIGELTLWRKHAGGVPEHRDLQFRTIDEITGDLLAAVRPDLIVSPAVSHGFDCIDVAGVLASLGYRGAYRALARDLPRPEMIRREVLAICPGLDFDIVSIRNDHLRLS